MFQSQEQDKAPEEEANGVEISNVTDKEFKVMILRCSNELRTECTCEKFNKELKKQQKTQTDLKNAVTRGKKIH